MNDTNGLIIRIKAVWPTMDTFNSFTFLGLEGNQNGISLVFSVVYRFENVEFLLLGSNKTSWDTWWIVLNNYVWPKSECIPSCVLFYYSLKKEIRRVFLFLLLPVHVPIFKIGWIQSCSRIALTSSLLFLLIHWSLVIRQTNLV